jgi:predicted acyl esterase
MALHMFSTGVHGMPAVPKTTPAFLYLTMGGHAAPAAPAAAEQDKLARQLQFLDHVFGIGRTPLPPHVVFWTRDPNVMVPSSSYQYPDGSWYRQTAKAWPPSGVRTVRYQLGADGHAVEAGAPAGQALLLPYAEDEARDPVAMAAAAQTPLGTSPVPSAVPPTSAPGFVAAFTTAPLAHDVELDGAPSVTATWVPVGPDSQLVVEVLDAAPDGTLTLLSRGTVGLRGATPGSPRALDIAGNSFSALLRAGHRVVTWVMAGDLALYKPYPDQTGGLLDLGAGAVLRLPLRATTR